SACGGLAQARGEGLAWFPPGLGRDRGAAWLGERDGRPVVAAEVEGGEVREGRGEGGRQGAAGRLGVRHRRAVAPRAAVPAGQRGQSRDAVVPDREGDAAVLHDGDQRLGRGGAAAHVAMARGTYASASGVATLP